ncbi:unnamed protein product [Polarella glacialis]|uniref:Uncharacterized protein n=1 Tax=Polarella glacialis TaxID=89957 RepID=A0A813H114_POLGL|nr:unnamed protein product [Polarella glacialis]
MLTRTLSSSQPGRRPMLGKKAPEHGNTEISLSAQIELATQNSPASCCANKYDGSCIQRLPSNVLELPISPSRITGAGDADNNYNSSNSNCNNNNSNNNNTQTKKQQQQLGLPSWFGCPAFD